MLFNMKNLKSWSPYFAQPVNSLNGTYQSIIVFFADDYHEFYEIKDYFKNKGLNVFYSEENSVLKAKGKKDFYQYIVSFEDFTEEKFAKMIIEANDIKSKTELENLRFSGDFYPSWQRVDRITPKKQKVIYKTEGYDVFLDSSVNPVWDNLLSNPTNKPKI
jgi:hypothetical protein